MKVRDVITMIDDIKPNAFSNATKTAWLNECEGMVQTDVMLLSPKDCITYDYDNDSGMVLLAPPPYDKIYTAYVGAMVDYANGEYDKYTNAMEMFNRHYGEYMRWFAYNVRPADNSVEAPGRLCALIIQGTTPTLEISGVPVAYSDVSALSLIIKQGGETAITKHKADVTITDGVLSYTMTAEDAAELTEGRANVSVIITDTDGTRIENYPPMLLLVMASAEDAE